MVRVHIGFGSSDMCLSSPMEDGSGPDSFLGRGSDSG